jgi:hypothetical protein
LSRRREVLRGEKVPATGGTVANRLVEGELAAFDDKRAVLAANGTESAAVRAGVLGTESLGLLLQESADGALDQTTSGSSGDLLHGHKVDRGVRARLAEGAVGDAFSPLGGQVMNLLELLRRELALRHSLSCLILATNNTDGFLLSL